MYTLDTALLFRTTSSMYLQNEYLSEMIAFFSKQRKFFQTCHCKEQSCRIGKAIDISGGYKDLSLFKIIFGSFHPLLPIFTTCICLDVASWQTNKTEIEFF